MTTWMASTLAVFAGGAALFALWLTRTKNAVKEKRLTKAEEVSESPRTRENDALVAQTAQTILMASDEHGELVLRNGDYGVFALMKRAGADLDIVFFHGLQVDPKTATLAWRSTWTNRDNVLWPKVWLAQDIKTANIWSVSFPASTVLGPGDGKHHWETLAIQLLNQLITRVVDIGGGNRKVVLVGHCAGGLILKQMILEAHGRSSTGDNKAKQLLKNLCGVAFYGTPHKGSEVLGLKEFVTSQKRSGDRENTELLQYMKVFDESTDLLHAKWNDVLAKQVVPLCFSEKQLTYLGALGDVKVVEQASAAIDAYKGLIEVDADHYNICKPQSKGDVAYNMLIEYILEKTDGDGIQ